MIEDGLICLAFYCGDHGAKRTHIETIIYWQHLVLVNP